MKKNYLFILAVITTLWSVNAQMIDDGFESYSLGNMSDQNPAVWSTSTGDPLADNALAVIEGGMPGQGAYLGPNVGNDVLLLLGNLTTGEAVLIFNAYIPAGFSALLNIQGQTETNGVTGHEGVGNNGVGIYNSGNMFFNLGGANPGLFADETTGETGNYPEDEWFTFHIEFDLFASTYQTFINNDVINETPVPFQADNVLGGIQFFAVNNDYHIYLDNVIFGLPIIGIDDFSTVNFSIAPNPVQDLLNIKSDNSVDIVQVFDIFGKLVLSITPETIAPAINVSSLRSGVYFVKVTIGNASKTIKIIK
ncbi:MAG: T9SS type A sorting domain-containing protein [Bacteroidota bacterium]